VAIKKFKESEEDEQVRRTTMRELRVLRQLKHENIVNLVEAFRRRGKLYLVFEYVERNMLEMLEEWPTGVSEKMVLSLTYQLLKAINKCHKHKVFHRDIKPENLLISESNELKLCDFGFARGLATKGPAVPYTEYVATRWYRGPELLVGASYGAPVDVWSIGCIMGELAAGEATFQGVTDIDQLYTIQRSLGPLPEHLQRQFLQNPRYRGVKFPKDMPKQSKFAGDFKKCPNISKIGIDVMAQMLVLDPDKRMTALDCLGHRAFSSLRVTDVTASSTMQQHDESTAFGKLGLKRRHGSAHGPKESSGSGSSGGIGSCNSSTGRASGSSGGEQATRSPQAADEAQPHVPTAGAAAAAAAADGATVRHGAAEVRRQQPGQSQWRPNHRGLGTSNPPAEYPYPYPPTEVPENSRLGHARDLTPQLLPTTGGGSGIGSAVGNISGRSQVGLRGNSAATVTSGGPVDFSKQYPTWPPPKNPRRRSTPDAVPPLQRGSGHGGDSTAHTSGHGQVNGGGPWGERKGAWGDGGGGGSGAAGRPASAGGRGVSHRPSSAAGRNAPVAELPQHGVVRKAVVRKAVVRDPHGWRGGGGGNIRLLSCSPIATSLKAISTRHGRSQAIASYPRAQLRADKAAGAVMGHSKRGMVVGARQQKIEKASLPAGARVAGSPAKRRSPRCEVLWAKIR
jgi:cyclin-dependent kinase-like